MRISPAAGIGVLAVATAALAVGALEWRASVADGAIGFWFEDDALVLPHDVALETRGHRPRHRSSRRA